MNCELSELWREANVSSLTLFADAQGGDMSNANVELWRDASGEIIFVLPYKKS